MKELKNSVDLDKGGQFGITVSTLRHSEQITTDEEKTVFDWVTSGDENHMCQYALMTVVFIETFHGLRRKFSPRRRRGIALRLSGDCRQRIRYLGTTEDSHRYTGPLTRDTLM